MKERFEKLESGFYIWDAPHRMIIIEKKGRKWECSFIRKSDDKRSDHKFNSLKKCYDFIEYWFDDFDELINFG